MVDETSDRSSHSSNGSDIFKGAKVVLRNQSDTHFKRSDTQLSTLLIQLY